MGLKQTTELYGRHNMFHGFVGNSCPGVFKDGNKYYIGNEGYDWDIDKVIDPLPGRYVSGVVTDLWWYCIADLEEFFRRGGKIYKNYDDVIDVEPGRYVLKHYRGIAGYKDYNSAEREIFATFELTNEPINKWQMPEEPLYRELPRIMTEIDHFWHEYKGLTDEFSLLMTVRSCYKQKRFVPRPDIPSWTWQHHWNSIGRLMRVEFPAELANEQKYDELAILIKKELRRDLKKSREHNKTMRILKKRHDKLNPKEKADLAEKQRQLIEKMLKELKGEK